MHGTVLWYMTLCCASAEVATHCALCCALRCALPCCLQFGVAVDADLEALNPGVSQWNIPEGTLMK